VIAPGRDHSWIERQAMTDALIDRFNRQIRYVRLSVTDRCDLRCGYCLPKGFKGFEEPVDWLDFDEITRVVGALARLGVRHVRLTGGEPLVRRDLPGLAARLAALPGLEDLSLSSNCTRMADLARPLDRAGIERLNVSLDSLRPEVFKEITGGHLAQVLRGIEAAHEVGFAPIRVNTVVLGGVDDTEIESILAFCAERGFTLRLIETMPIGATGRSALSRYVDLREIKQRLARRFALIPDLLPGGGPARHYRLGSTETRKGEDPVTPAPTGPQSPAQEEVRRGTESAHCCSPLCTTGRSGAPAALLCPTALRARAPRADQRAPAHRPPAQAPTRWAHDPGAHAAGAVYPSPEPAPDWDLVAQPEPEFDQRITW
jgi:cyclic pyranopterin phosphate synthase